MGLGRVLVALGAAAVGGFALHAGDAGAQGFMSQFEDSDQLADESERHPHIPDIEILVSSFGGVGTTDFIRELHRLQPPLKLNQKDDLDHLKHRPFQKLLTDGTTKTKMGGIKKILYVYGEPVKSILSLAHRGYLNVQSRKVRTDPVPKHFGQYYPTLEDLVSCDGDYLQLDRHFESFWSQCQYDIAFLDATRKMQEMPALARYLGTTKAELAKRLVPWNETPLSRRELAAHYNTTVDVVEGLTRKYANLSGRLSALPALLIKHRRPEGCDASA